MKMKMCTFFVQLKISLSGVQHVWRECIALTVKAWRCKCDDISMHECKRRWDRLCF